jgi:hypothetical protein
MEGKSLLAHHLYTDLPVFIQKGMQRLTLWDSRETSLGIAEMQGIF